MKQFFTGVFVVLLIAGAVGFDAQTGKKVAQPAKKETKYQTVYFFDTDLNKVGKWVCQWSELGFHVEMAESQSVAIGHLSKSERGNILVVMTNRPR